jgi:hypothetical protein
MSLIVARPSTIPASQIVVTPVADVDATQLQTAIQELANEKVAVGPANHNVPSLWRGTHAEYDALTPEDGVVYFVLPDADELVVSVYVGRLGGVQPAGRWFFSVAAQSGQFLTVGF